MEIERNLLAAPQAAHQRVDVYSGVARLAKTVWASEVRATRGRRRRYDLSSDGELLGHYAPPGLAARGVAGVGLTTLRRQRHVVDHGELSARHRVDGGASASVGYEKVVLIGNRGSVDRAVLPGVQAESPGHRSAWRGPI
jgi:hypothetical protein